MALISTGVPPVVVGGMQRHSLCLARHLALNGADVDLYHTDLGMRNPDRADAAEHFRTERFATVFVPWRKAGRLPGHFVRETALYGRAVMEAIQSRPAVDFIYSQGSTGLAIMRARQDGACLPPIGMNGHGLEMFQRPASVRSRLEGLLLRPGFSECVRLSDIVFSFGGAFPKFLTEVLEAPPRKIAVVPNGIDESWVRHGVLPVHSPVRFVFVGRFERRKGLPELNDAILDLPRDARFEIDFVGPIPPDHRLSRKGVRYHGAVTDDAALQATLDACDCLVCPSHAEGMPTVILEAMARGLAIVATDVGAVRELVGPDNGVLIPRPEPGLISAALRKVIGLPDRELLAMKCASLNRVAEYSWSRVANLTMDHIRSVVR